MKVLFLSNFYPPQSRGGFEQWAREVAEELVRRGNQVRVLTSTYGRKTLPNSDPAWVRRELFLEMEFSSLKNALLFFTSRRKRKVANLARLEQAVREFAPDVILLWGMWNLPRSLPVLAEKLMHGRVAYYMGDFWPNLPVQFKNYWEAPARNGLTGLLKSVLKPLALNIVAGEEKLPLQMRYAIFPSEFMQSEFIRLGMAPEKSQIVYGAVDTAPYLKEPDCRDRNDAVSLLFVGRLEPEKGVHTTIQAMGHLVRTAGIPAVKLTILGSGEPAYEAHLHELAAQENVASLVTFLPAQPSRNPAFHLSSG